MEATKQFEKPGTKLSRFINLNLSISCRILAFLINLIRSILRFRLLKRIEFYFFEKSRLFSAKAIGINQPIIDVEIVKKDVVTIVPDEPNIRLHGNLYLPKIVLKDPSKKVPVILVRTPYDKDSPLLGKGLAQVFAERGYAVLVQDTRGRFGSGGDFFPIAHEVKDGGVTVRWLREQPWSNGKVGAFGISYLGLTAYAAAGSERIDALVPVLASSRLYPIIYHDGTTFAFDLVIRWLWLVMNVMHETNPFKKILKILTPGRQLESALNPAGDTSILHRDSEIVGKELHFYRQVLHAHELGHDFWINKDILCDLSDPEHSPPLSIIAGWYDFFVAQSFKDFESASKVATSHPLTMICGVWSHWSFVFDASIGFNVALELFDQQLMRNPKNEICNGESTRPTKIYVQVIHSESEKYPNGRWLQFNMWPPQNTKKSTLFLGAGGRLDTAATSGNGFTEQIYDPENPTPHAGGNSFDWLNTGMKRQNELESRDDVATFTTSPLTEELLVVGNVKFQLQFWSSNPHTDVFVKLCQVDGETGLSLNVLEKLVRLSPTKCAWDAKGNVTLDIDLGPIAVLFNKGNMVRIQISGGAHPNYLRHHGTDDPTSMDLEKAERRVIHSFDCPSFLTLPTL